MKLNWLSIGLLAALSRDADAFQKGRRDTPRDQLQYGVNYFDQKVNHFPDDPQFNISPLSNNTFKQRYYFDSTYYKPGELSSYFCHVDEI